MNRKLKEHENIKCGTKRRTITMEHKVDIIKCFEKE